MDAVMAAWMVEVGIIAVRDLTGPRRLPLPSELLATFVVFGGLGLLRGSPTTRGAAGATAWGLVVATLLSSKVDVLAPVGDFLTGKIGGPTGAAPLTSTGPATAPASTGPPPTGPVGSTHYLQQRGG